MRFYGIDAPEIKESLNVEVHDIKVAELRLDNVLKLADKSLLHFEFQSQFNHSDVYRFGIYDLLLSQKEGGLNVKTVVIYAPNVKEADLSLNWSTLYYKPEIILMSKFNGNLVLQDLEKKFSQHEKFDDMDLLNMI